MSFLNKLTHRNQTGVAAPYTQQQLLAQQQGLGAYGTQQPIYGANNVITEQQLIGQQSLVPFQQQQLVGQQQFIQQRGSLQVNEPATTTTLQPIVQQSIRQDRVVEVQPIIHRDIERPVVNHIERHITEAAPVSRAGAIQHGAIVEERVHNRMINEIQPVIHREIAVPQVEQVQQHFVERVVANPQHTRQVVYEPQQQFLQQQQFIQQPMMTQQLVQQPMMTQQLVQQPQYLQTGMLQSRGLTGVGHISQAQYLQQQSLLNPNQAIHTNQLLGRDINGGLLQHQQLLPQNYGSSRSTLPPNMLNRGLLGQQTMIGQPMMTQQFVQQPIMTQQSYISQPQYISEESYGQQFGQQNFLGQQQFGQQNFLNEQQFGQQNLGLGQQQLYNNENIYDQGLVGQTTMIQQQPYIENGGIYNEQYGRGLPITTTTTAVPMGGVGNTAVIDQSGLPPQVVYPENFKGHHHGRLYRKI